MLVVFYGTSCVGKSTIMDFLHRHYGWIMVPVFMTRVARENEYEKFYMSKEELVLGEERGEFLPLNECYGNFYGTPTKQLRQAVDDKKNFWCIDYPINRKVLLSDYKSCDLVLLPYSREQLERQIISAGRINRREMVLNEYDNLYSHLGNEYVKVINKEDDVIGTCDSVLKAVNAFFSSAET